MEPNKILVVLLFFLGWNSSSIGQENLKGHEFEVHNGDITLSASLYLPDNDMSNYPVAIMVPGSVLFRPSNVFANVVLLLENALCFKSFCSA